MSFTYFLFAPACASSGYSIEISATSGTLPYQYSFDNISFTSSNIFSGLPNGTYTIYVKDATNETVNTAITLFQLEPLEVLLGFTLDIPTSAAFANVSGGV